MARTRQPIQTVVPKRLRAALVGETGAIPHAVVEIVRLVDLGRGGCELMQNIGDLRSRIVEGGLHVMFIACILGSSSWYGV